MLDSQKESMSRILMISGFTPSFKHDSALRGVRTTFPGGGLMFAAVWVEGLLNRSSMDKGIRIRFLRIDFDLENPEAEADESLVWRLSALESGRP